MKGFVEEQTEGIGVGVFLWRGIFVAVNFLVVKKIKIGETILIMERIKRNDEVDDFERENEGNGVVKWVV